MNQYPAHSIAQAIERLPLRARRKYDDLRALLADSEALQRSLLERIRSKEEQLAALVRRHDYAVGDSNEIARLDIELAAVSTDLGRLERERSRRNSIRSNTEQVISRLNVFVGELFSGAHDDVTPPPWPTNVPVAREDESVGDAILRLRHEISIAQGELMRLKAAPPPATEITAAIRAEVDRLAGDGVPRIAVDAGRVTIHWPDQQRHSVPGAALSAPSGSASKLMCALFPEPLKQLLCAGITDTKNSVSSADRPRLVREAETRALALEVGEERLVCQALDAGLEVHRRIDASPWAILYSDVEAVHAEAAE